MLKLIPLKELFTPVYGVNLELIHVEECEKKDLNSIRFVSRTEQNNGVSAYVKRIDEITPNPAHTISVAVSGSVLSSFYQDEEYYSGRDLYYLLPKRKMSKEEMLFYAFCIKANKYKYNYGRAANKTLKHILVPKFIPQEFANIDYDKLNTLNPQSVINQDFELDTSNWEYFITTDIFQDIVIAKSIDLNKLESDASGINYIGRTRENNGRTAKVEYKNEYKKYINDRNCVTIAMVGDSTCSAFFQSEDFFASQNLLTLRNKNINEYNSIFLSVLIYLEKYRFSYGRTLTKSYFENMKIKLPVNEKGEPDWKFMESYIKSLPYSSSI